MRSCAWEVKPDPEASGARSFIGKRILSFGMVLTLAFLLLVSLILSAALSEVASSVLSLAVIAVLFSAIFRYQRMRAWSGGTCAPAPS